MLNFAWNCFRITGSVDAYLLYRDLRNVREPVGDGETEEDEEENR
jgi:hypothetical protein